MQKEWKNKEDFSPFNHQLESSEKIQHLWRVMSIYQAWETRRHQKRLEMPIDAVCPNFERHNAWLGKH